MKSLLERKYPAIPEVNCYHLFWNVEGAPAINKKKKKWEKHFLKQKKASIPRIYLI